MAVQFSRQLQIIYSDNFVRTVELHPDGWYNDGENSSDDEQTDEPSESLHMEDSSSLSFAPNSPRKRINNSLQAWSTSPQRISSDFGCGSQYLHFTASPRKQPNRLMTSAVAFPKSLVPAIILLDDDNNHDADDDHDDDDWCCSRPPMDSTDSTTTSCTTEASRRNSRGFRRASSAPENSRPPVTCVTALHESCFTLILSPTTTSSPQQQRQQRETLSSLPASSW